MASRHLTVGIFALTAIFFGTQFVGIRTAVGAIPPVFYAGLRFDISAVVALTYVRLKRGTWRPRTRGDYDLRTLIAIGRATHMDRRDRSLARTTRCGCRHSAEPSKSLIGRRRRSRTRDVGGHLDCAWKRLSETSSTNNVECPRRCVGNGSRRGLDSCDECYDRRVRSGDSGDANYRRSRAICWRVLSRDRLSDVPLANRNRWTDSDKLDHLHCSGGCRGNLAG